MVMMAMPFIHLLSFLRMWLSCWVTTLKDSELVSISDELCDLSLVSLGL